MKDDRFNLASTGRSEAGLEAAAKQNGEPSLATPEDIINEARNGRMFILVDDADRENEGDLIIPAQMATPDAINFMATHGRGLICLALTKARVDQLGLRPMASTNEMRHETAFTVSIEAKHGVTTGISAADRARTIAVAIDSGTPADQISSPGHVFPLAARAGGVLVRAGHTEAAVDVARLAGLNPSGVICEIMKEDGTMARLDDLMLFAERFNLKIGTIRDLIAYRRRNDHLVERRAETRFTSVWGGEWTAIAFWNTAEKSETLALVKGVVDPALSTLVRMHTITDFADTYGEISPRSRLLSRSMEIIGEQGRGVLVIINRRGPGTMTALLRAHAAAAGHDQESSDNDIEQVRDYGLGAQILAELGVHDMVLLSNSRQTLVGLSGYGLSIVGQRAIDVD